MKMLMALSLTLPLFACEKESLMERTGETLNDAGDEVADVINDAREEAEESID